MLGNSPVITFVATTKPDAARAFYEGVLGLAFVADDPFALVFDASGVMLRMFKVESHTPPSYTVLGWTVPHIEAMIDGLAARGVTFERFAGMEQDARGIWMSPSGARVAWFKDPDGNVLSLTQF
jgi:catechol 2,3-dioxygenase-like lactoylglutathione lyase family enzyme